MQANISFFGGIFGASFTTRQGTFSFVSFKSQCYHIGQFVEDSVHSHSLALHIKSSFPLRISSVNVTEPQETADLITFTEEILNGKLHFLCSVGTI